MAYNDDPAPLLSDLRPLFDPAMPEATYRVVAKNLFPHRHAEVTRDELRKLVDFEFPPGVDRLGHDFLRYHRESPLSAVATALLQATRNERAHGHPLGHPGLTGVPTDTAVWMLSYQEGIERGWGQPYHETADPGLLQRVVHSFFHNRWSRKAFDKVGASAKEVVRALPTGSRSWGVAQRRGLSEHLWLPTNRSDVARWLAETFPQGFLHLHCNRVCSVVDGATDATYRYVVDRDRKAFAVVSGVFYAVRGYWELEPGGADRVREFMAQFEGRGALEDLS